MSLSPPIEKNEIYEPGEEVVVRLDGVKNVRAEGQATGAPSLPHWTIAEVLARRDGERGVLYDVRFRHGGEVYVCQVDGASIEGTA